MNATVKRTGMLVVAGLLALPQPSQAGGLDVSVVIGNDHGHYGRDAYRLGYQRGREDGFEHGARDARRRRSLDFAHDKEYRRGDAGYRRSYGPKPVYANGYRRGYEEGYRRAYRSAYASRHRHRSHLAWCYERHECRDCEFDRDDRRGADDDWRDRGRRNDDGWRD
jgi:hypothetical protein